MAIQNNRPVFTSIRPAQADSITQSRPGAAGGRPVESEGIRPTSQEEAAAPSTNPAAGAPGPSAQRAATRQSLLNADSGVALRQLQANQQLGDIRGSSTPVQALNNATPRVVTVREGDLTIEVREMNEFRNGVSRNEVPALQQRAVTEKAADDIRAYSDDMARYFEENGTGSFDRAVAAFNRDFGTNIRPSLNIRNPDGSGRGRPEIQRGNDQAVRQVLEANPQLAPRVLREMAIDSGYFNSEGHRGWAEAAEARTAGKIPAEWWLRFDPFGGTAGNGPDIVPSGRYPGVASRIAMAHDTDWSLGRYFGFGPMEALRGAEGFTPEELGMVGLRPDLPWGRFAGIDSYANGHPDWTVRYN